MNHNTIKLLALLALLTPGAACKSSATKAGGKTGSAAASAKQKSGSKAMESKDAGSSQGPDYDGVTCGADLEGVGWCSTDDDIVSCSGGEWWLLTCSAIDDTAFCGFDEDLEEVDCYVEG